MNMEYSPPHQARIPDMNRVAPLVDLKVPLMHCMAAFPSAAAPGLVLCVDGCSPDSVSVWDVSLRGDGTRGTDDEDGYGSLPQRPPWGSCGGRGA